MDLELFKEKVDDGTLTVGEAFEFVENNPGSSKGQKKVAKKLKNNLPFSMNKPYFEVYQTDEFINAVQGPVNRFKDFSSFESGLQKGLVRTQSFKDKDYRLLSRSTGLAAQTKEGAGVQDRTLKPMRGTIYSADLDEMYHRHLQNNSYPELKANGEPALDKQGKPKRVFISQDTKDYMIYEKATGQRLDSNVGKDGIKLSDVTITERADGSVIAEVAEKKTATKTRPRIKYEGEFALFLKHLHNKAKNSKRASGKDPKTVDLFNTTPDKVNGVWNHFFRPEIEARFPTQLPSGEKATPKVIRKILARILEDEFQVDTDLVDSWIGHAGGETKARLSTKAYAGVVSDKRIGPLVNNMVRNDAFNTKTTVNDLFVERGSNVPEFKDGSFTYVANKEPYTYSKDANTVPQKIKRTRQEISTSNQIAKTKETKARLEELEYEEKILSQEAINQEKALQVAQRDPEITKKIAEGKALQKKAQLEADIAAGLKSEPKKSAKGGINLGDVFSSEEWDDLTKGLKTLAIGTGVVGAVSQFITDPAQAAQDVATELLLERGLGMGPGATVGFAMQSSPAGAGSEFVPTDPTAEYRTISDDQYANMTSMGLETSEQDMATTSPMNYAMDQQMSDLLRKDIPDEQGIM